MDRQKFIRTVAGGALAMPESSIETAVAVAEQDGLRFLLRVRLVVLAAVALWLITNYAPLRLALGLLTVAAFALSGVAQYQLGRRWGRPVFWAGVFTVLEVALLITVVLAPFTFPGNWPPQMQLRLVLAAAVVRSRSLLRRQVADHLARANLARYFSPNVVDVLAGAGPTGTAARHQRVAVLFADVRGFTRISESVGAERTMAFLQGFHERVTRVVFEHGGTLEKYIGDAVMATFGTPSSGPDDAGRALRCAVTLAGETSRWSAERVARGELPVEIGIGVHYGNAVVGSIGDGQRLDYLVIGDTVNVTSRLERLTREMDAQIVVTDELVTQVRAEGTAADGLLHRFTPRGEVRVAARDQPIRVWTAQRGQQGPL